MSKTKMTSNPPDHSGPGDGSDHRPELESVADFERRARSWLAAHGRRRVPGSNDSLALFPEWERPESATWVDDARMWLTARHEAGFAGITISRASGGLGLTAEHQHAFESAESEYETAPDEIWAIGHHMVIPAIDRFGTAEQRRRFIVPGLRGDLVFCQLFSEPDAGSDLAGLRTTARRDGDAWIVDGQKVWTSVAHVAHYGMLLCRTDPAAPKHRGITCFLVPLDSPGVTVRPIRQITGGSAFNEVFLDGVVVPDELRLGAEGDGWAITRTTLNLERVSLSLAGPNTDPTRLIALARERGVAGDAVVRQSLADVVTRRRVTELTSARVTDVSRSGGDPGPLASTLKLLSTELLRTMGHTAALILGASLVADTGEWGTYAWGRQILETAGLRIGGGTDEIQRNVLAEGILRLPRDPRPATASEV